MKRFITDQLISWKDKSGRKPLILRGARQVGKSWVVNDFGERHFGGRVHTVNFEKHPEWHGIFDLNYDVRRIVSELELVLNVHIEAGRDLLFFDEIQTCPKAIMALRYFYEDLPGLHLIAAGSLLEFALRDISVPVGRVQFMNMYPMSFPEFLIATGKDKLAALTLAPPERLSETLHQTLLNEVKVYFLIGGMPESVKVYAETGRTRSSFGIQRDLVNTFRDDFSKYSPVTDKRCLNAVLTSVAKLAGKQIKYTLLSDQFSLPTVKKAFQLLEQARLLDRVAATSPAGLPLGASASEKKFKALMTDIGILRQLTGLPVEAEYFSSGLLSVYQGGLAEQFVGQQLLAASDERLYYWSRDAKSSTAEVDFLFSKNGEICPAEVKSGVSGKLKSLHMLLAAYPNLRQGYVFSEAPYGEIREQRLVFVPLYYAYQLGLPAL